MYCKSCLAANPDNAVICAQCGAPLTDAIPGAAVPPIVPVPPIAVAPAEPEFELQPEHAKAPDTGPAPLPSGAGDSEKKEDEKPPPPLPRDFKTNAIVLLVCSIFPFFLCCCSRCFPVASLAGMLFGLLALLESGKVKPAYEAGEFAEAEEASEKTYKYVKLGVISIGVCVVLAVAFNVLWGVLWGFGGFTKMTHQYFNQ